VSVGYFSAHLIWVLENYSVNSSNSKSYIASLILGYFSDDLLF
jgi:hypothetical protein